MLVSGFHSPDGSPNPSFLFLFIFGLFSGILGRSHPIQYIALSNNPFVMLVARIHTLSGPFNATAFLLHVPAGKPGQGGSVPRDGITGERAVVVSGEERDETFETRVLRHGPSRLTCCTLPSWKKRRCRRLHAGAAGRGGK